VFDPSLTQTSDEVTASESDGEGEVARPTPLWILTQLVPSPEVAIGDGVARFGLRWQVTSLLYSFGINRRVSPWRVLVVEPLVRQSGSVELYMSPEYLVYGRGFGDGWLWRAGVRSYLPLIERGDYLSVSVGSSFYAFAGHTAVAYEAGVYGLFGIIGAQLTWSPAGGPRRDHRDAPAQVLLTLEKEIGSATTSR